MLEQVTALNQSQMWVHSKGRRRLTIFILKSLVFYFFLFVFKLCLNLGWTPSTQFELFSSDLLFFFLMQRNQILNHHIEVYFSHSPPQIKIKSQIPPAPVSSFVVLVILK